MLSREESVDAFASFLVNKLDFYNLDAKSIYARVSALRSMHIDCGCGDRNSQYGCAIIELKAIMQYAQAVRLE